MSDAKSLEGSEDKSKAVAPGLDDPDQPKQDTPTAQNQNRAKQRPPRPSEPKPLETSAEPDEKEFGRQQFQPQCGACSNATKRTVRMVLVRTDGPIAYYQCKRCAARIKLSRPWRPRERFDTPNVAARPDMQ